MDVWKYIYRKLQPHTSRRAHAWNSRKGNYVLVNAHCSIWRNVRNMDILNACNWRWFCWWRPCRGNTVRRHADWLCSICTQKNRGTRMINHCCHLKNNKRNLVIFIIFTFIEVNIGQNAITNTSIRNVYVFVYRAEFSFIMYCVMNSVCIIL